MLLGVAEKDEHMNLPQELGKETKWAPQIKRESILGWVTYQLPLQEVYAGKLSTNNILCDLLMNLIHVTIYEFCIKVLDI